MLRPRPPRRARASSAAARTRAPITFAIAFAIAPAVGTHGGSPTPFEPFGPAFGVSVSIQCDVDLRRVGGGRRACSRAGARSGGGRRSSSCVPSDKRLPDPHHDAAVDLAVGADPVEDPAAVVRGGDLQHADDARLRGRPSRGRRGRSAAARGTTRARAGRRSPPRGCGRRLRQLARALAVERPGRRRGRRS